MKKSIFLFFATLLCATSAWASQKLVVGVAANNDHNYNMHLGVQAKDWSWQDITMSLAGLTFEGKKLYITNYETQDSKIIGQFQFMLFDGNTWKEEKQLVKSWNEKSDYYTNHIYNYDDEKWYDRLSFETNANFYFDASNWTETSIKLCIGHANYQKYYNLTQIPNTKLYYGKPGDTWGDAMGIGVVGKTTATDGTNWLTNVSSKAKEYTGFKNYGLTSTKSGHAYLMVNAGKTGEQPEMHYNESYTNLNSKQTIMSACKVTGGNYEETNTPAKISITSYAFTANGVATKQNVSLATTAKSVSVDAARTATTTLKIEAVPDGYKFDGWFKGLNDGDRLSEELTYTYYPTEETTIYARFSEDVYYLAGTLDGNDAWNADELPMEKNIDGTYSYTFEDLEADEYEFKVTDGTWDKKWDWYNVVGNYYNLSEGDDKKIKLNLTETTTFTIIFNKNENKITFTGLKPATYTVAGDNRIAFGDTWNPGNTSNDMNLVDNLYTWTKTKIGLRAGTEIKFKVVKNHNWDHGSWPTDNNWVINTISKDGFYTITITFNEATKNVKATATWTGEAPFKDFTNQPAKLYFYPTSDWKKDNAQFAAYFYNEGFGADAEPKWQDMTDPDGDGIYELDNAKEHEYVMFCRMNPSRSENNWDADVAWNKIETGLVIPNTAGELNICCTFWTNAVGNRPTSECVWVVPTPLADNNWSNFVSAYSGKTVNALIKRTFRSGQNHTLCLPFNLPTSWLGDGSKAYQLNSIFANTADELQLNASEVSTIEAGKPYIIVPIKGPEYENLIIADVTVVKDIKDGSYTISGGGYKATVKAVTTTGGLTNGSTEYYVGANDGYLYNAVVDKLGLRAIIELTTTSGQPLPARVRARVVNSENAATGVDNITNTDNTTIKVIENGQLIIIRNGEKFNAQGVRF